MASKENKETKKTSRKSTASKTTRKASGKSAAAKKVDTPKVPLKQRLAEFFGVKLNFGISMVLLVVAFIMLLSMVSYIVNGHLDQALADNAIGVSGTHVNNWCGRLGLSIAHYFMEDCFGLCSIFIPLFIVLVSMRLLDAYGVRLWKWFINFSLIMMWGSVALAYIENHFPLPTSVLQILPFPWGGRHGNVMCQDLVVNVGSTITFIILVVLLLFYFVYVTGETVDMVRKLFRPQDFIRKHSADSETEEGEDVLLPEESDEEEPEGKDAEGEESEGGAPVVIDLDDLDTPATEDAPVLTPEQPAADDKAGADESEFVVEVAGDTEEADGDDVANAGEMGPYDPRLDLPNYKFPGIDLLDDHGASNSVGVDLDEQRANKARIIEVLHNFGVEITSIKATVGPTITLYEITPAPGVRINKIRNLEDDIALSLAANGIRIIAPIPGKGTIGIEVPNAKPQTVSMQNLINSKVFQETKYDLPIALGKTITNEVYMVDLAKLPHLLVAGATGQGKSVGLNAIIGSLLYKKHPAELKFVMVDPKKVEFSIYAPLLKHFLAAIPDNDEPIITDVHKVVRTLKSLCVEMDARYDLLKMAKCKNVKEYNAKFRERHLSPSKGHRFMPYIVVIIDEFGDLIMTAGKEVELPIARIAQLARAVGIHMVIATQRPTTTIITGNIKANFPGRMAFKVMQRIDSQTILDRTGANQLVGRGDMLFLAGADPVRVQCAFLDTPEVEAISEFIGEQTGYFGPYELPEPPADDSAGGGGGMPADVKLDDMFVEIAQWVVAAQQGSTSAIQRKFEIGYNRAGRITDQLEKAGIVGPARGAKPREVLIQDDQSLQTILEMMQAR